MTLLHNKFYWFYALLVATSCQQQSPPSSTEIISTFQIEDGFQIELIASEPYVLDPVAMEIDEYGRFYVVEMPGYPLDVQGDGRVKLLSDEDGDGIIDKSQVFYDGLVLPTGIMRWKNGILVTDPPDVLYLEDTDGDGVSDKKEVVLTGFALSNPQHNFNDPTYGLDNWIYLANEGTYQSKGFEDLFNDEGKEIHFPGHPKAPKLPRNANDLNVRFNPDQLTLEMLSGYTQFGQAFDRWGHHFLTNNSRHLFHEVMGAQYLMRNQYLVVPSDRHYVPDYGIGFDIFPITQNPEHQLLTDVGAITSSCGVTWYLGGLFPESYQNVTFIAEPSHNLVHTDNVYDNGATFGSKRHLENREFLASTDGWFRPVNFYIGPDGSMYLLDYHRKIIEHPEWISEEVLNSGDLYQGNDKGRIFRISPRGTPSPLAGNITLGEANDDDLIDQLQNPNIWWRRHAQRLLVDRQNAQTITKLKEFIKATASALGMVHGLWTLDGLQEFDKDLIQMAFIHAEPGVRENAIKIAEKHREDFPELSGSLAAMKNDPDPKVRFQLLCTLGYFDSKEASEASRELLFQDIEDPWMQIAALSAGSLDVLGLFQEASKALGSQESEGRKIFFNNLAKTVAKEGNAVSIRQVVQTIVNDQSKENNWWQAVSLEGLSQVGVMELSLNRATLNSLAAFFSEHTNAELRSGCLELLNAIGYFKQPQLLSTKAVTVAEDDKLSPEYRGDALKVLGWYHPLDNEDIFHNILRSNQSFILHKAAIGALSEIEGTGPCEFLIDNWKELTPQTRDAAINIFNTNQRRLLLIEAVENAQVQASTIGWPRTVGLLNSSNDEVRDRARSVLQGNESVSDSIWVEYQSVLAMEGTAARGGNIFKQSCSSCHQISDQNGVPFGPDLSAIRNRDLAGIMVDILRPNKSIADGYELWTIIENNGNTQSGMVVQESVNSLTLRNAIGEEMLILRADIESLSASEISAMPEGLYQSIDQQQMADLLEFIKSGN